MKFHHILVVLNPENEKQFALARAVRLVKEQKSEQKVKITAFLTAYDVSYQMSTLGSAQEREEMMQGVIQQRTEAIQPYFEKYADPNIEFNATVVWHSNEAEAISAEVEKNHYDLVVKYTKEETNFTSLIFTPMDWQLLRKCPVPMLMVRDADWKHQRRILIAVNVGDDEEHFHQDLNEKLVSLGIDLADNLERGNVHLVSAYPPMPINMAIDLPEFSHDEQANTTRGQYLINMKALRQRFAIDEDHTHVYEGFPEEIIPKVAQELEAELVVLGTIGRTGLSAALIGNTAEHVINRLSCNLLAIKPNKR